MTRGTKLLLILAGLVIFIWAAGVFLTSQIDTAYIKDQLEMAISSASGFETEIHGPVNLQVFHAGASFEKVVFSHDGKEVLAVGQAKVRIKLLPLLRKEVQIASLSLEAPVLSVRAGEGLLPERRSQDESPGSIRVPVVSIQDGSIRHLASSGQSDWELTGLDLEISHLALDEQGNLSFSGVIRFDRLGTDRLKVVDLEGRIFAENHLVRGEALQGRLNGNDFAGSLELNVGSSPMVWKGVVDAERLSLEKLSLMISETPVFEGLVKLQAELGGKIADKYLDTLTGSIKVSGRKIIQHGFNMDRFIKEYRETRDIDLVDIGVYAFAGPVGALVTKGEDVTGLVLAMNRKERQTIEELSFNWILEKGVARTDDVALRTEENRLAVKGEVDLSQQRYRGMTLGLLNTEGCAEMTLNIKGPLEEPVVEKASIVSTLADSLLGIFKRGWQVVNPSDCQPFYQGAVGHPE